MSETSGVCRLFNLQGGKLLIKVEFSRLMAYNVHVHDMYTTLYIVRRKSLKLKDFAKEHNLDNQTVSRYINRHKELFDQHAIKEGQNIILDDVALEILGKKYPFPEPVVVQDQAAREKLLEVTEKYAAAMEKITLLTEQNAQLLVIQSKQRFLEEENKNLTDDLDRTEQELRKITDEQKGWMRTFKSQEKEVAEAEMLLKREREEHRMQLAKLQSELEAEKNKTWWDKLRGR